MLKFLAKHLADVAPTMLRGLGMKLTDKFWLIFVHLTMGTTGPSSSAKEQPGCDADHLPPSSAKVENE
jgi:hypothetical protein